MAATVGRRLGNSLRRSELPRPAKVLLIASNPRDAFVAQDLAILAERFEVEVLAYGEVRGNLRLVPALARRLAVGRYDLVYQWFAEPHNSHWIALLTRCLGIKSVIVTGGYDLAAMPEIGYGALLTRGGRWRVKAGLAGAHLLLPFSDFAAGELRRLTARGRQRRIYPGVDCTFFGPNGSKEPLVVTAAFVGRRMWRRKGLDAFARCSRLMPEARFVVVGACLDPEIAEALRHLGGDNLELTLERVAPEELRGWFQRASVYAQLSAHEGFGLALAEAMACGCVPVATTRGSIPEVVGDAGPLVAHGDDEAAVGAIRQALAQVHAFGASTMAHQRIREKFPIERRRRELLATVTDLLGEW